MKLNKLYNYFFGLALISFSLGLVIKVSGFNLVFEITILEYTIQNTYHTLWLLMGCYFFYLALPYFLISKSKLKPNTWLLNSHGLIAVLFFLLLLVFSCIDLNLFKNVKALFNLSDFNKIGLYVYSLFFTIILFILNVLLLILNLTFLRMK